MTSYCKWPITIFAFNLLLIKFPRFSLTFDAQRVQQSYMFHSFHDARLFLSPSLFTCIKQLLPRSLIFAQYSILTWAVLFKPGFQYPRASANFELRY